MYKNIIVALSLEHGISDSALSVAKILSSDDTTITALHVHGPLSQSILAYIEDDVLEKSQMKAQTRLEERIEDVPGAKAVLLEGQSPGRVIVEYANRHHADCIIIGSHQPGLRDFFLGSTAARVVRHAHCAVHVIR